MTARANRVAGASRMGPVELLSRIDAFCDAVPRAGATAVDDGPLRLFVRSGKGWPYYARPIPGGAPITVADVDRMRLVQRTRGVPEAFEWVDAAAPTMAAAVRASGLPVQVCPLLVLDGEPGAPPLPLGYVLRLVGPLDADLAAAEFAVRSVAAVAFGGAAPGPPVGTEVSRLREDLASGRLARVLVTGPDGPVAAGAAQRAGGVVELVGIATAAPHRGRGLAAAVTAALARSARDAGAELVFLAAGSETATRVYERVGFRRVGTCGIAEP